MEANFHQHGACQVKVIQLSCDECREIRAHELNDTLILSKLINLLHLFVCGLCANIHCYLHRHIAYHFNMMLHCFTVAIRIDLVDENSKKLKQVNNTYCIAIIYFPIYLSWFALMNLFNGQHFQIWRELSFCFNFLLVSISNHFSSVWMVLGYPNVNKVRKVSHLDVFAYWYSHCIVL